MECFRSGVALGRQVIRPLAKLLLAGGMLVIPLFLSAHNGEFILAKWQWNADNSADLILTVDFEANPRIKTAQEFRQQAPNFFKLAGKNFQTSLNSPEITTSYHDESHLDPAVPMGHRPEELAQTYKLGILRYHWSKAPNSFVLQVPPECNQTFILWTALAHESRTEARWVILIGGDESPLLQKPKPAPPSLTERYLGLAIIAFLGALIFHFGTTYCYPLIRRKLFSTTDNGTNKT